MCSAASASQKPTEQVADAAATAALATQQAAEQIFQAASIAGGRGRRGAATALAELLGQIRHHDGGKDRQQLGDEVAATTSTTAEPAELAHHLFAIVAEDVADDLVAIDGVDLTEVDPTIEKVVVVLAKSLAERRGA